MEMENINTPKIPKENHPYWIALLTQQIEEEYYLYALKVMTSFTIKEFKNGKLDKDKAIADLRKIYLKNPNYIANLSQNMEFAKRNKNSISSNSDMVYDEIEKTHQVKVTKKKKNWFTGLFDFMKK